jgi:ankyrin repeat protein
MKTTFAGVAVIALLSVSPLHATDREGAVLSEPARIENSIREISPFCKAILNGDLQTVEKMIALGENVNRKSLGRTPLIYAARYNQAEIAQTLLEHGADPNIRCDKGYSAIQYAERSKADEVLTVLKNAMKI